MLPHNFSEVLLRVLEPGSEIAAAEVIREAAALDDLRLGCFLQALTEDVRRLRRRLTAEDVRAAFERCR